MGLDSKQSNGEKEKCRNHIINTFMFLFMWSNASGSFGGSGLVSVVHFMLLWVSALSCTFSFRSECKSKWWRRKESCKKKIYICIYKRKKKKRKKKIKGNIFIKEEKSKRKRHSFHSWMLWQVCWRVVMEVKPCRPPYEGISCLSQEEGR